jgi:hypothetical protein
MLVEEFITWLLWFLTPLLAGFAVTSFLESYLHQHLQHAKGPMMRPLVRIVHSEVHHNQTFRSSYVQQFSSEKERFTLNRLLEAKYPTMAADIREQG